MREVRCGRWQDVLDDVVQCDAVITDPPYSQVTHQGTGTKNRRDSYKESKISYGDLDEEGVREFVEAWHVRCRGWICVLTDDVLAYAYRAAFFDVGRVVFAPVPVIMPDSVRLCGDGPASAAVYLVVSRPRSIEYAQWGSLPGWYRTSRAKCERVVGGKRVSLMRQIVGHYSRPGDLVVDPFAGEGSTLTAAHEMGRSCVGAEVDPKTHATCARKLADANVKAREVSL